MTIKKSKAVFVKIFQSDWFWGIITFLSVFSLYVNSMPRTITGYGDSDLFLLLSQKLGLPLPPGYPLYLWVLFFFTKFPWPWSLPISGHLLNIFFSAISVLGIYLISARLIDRSLSKHRSKTAYSIFIKTLTALTVSYSLAFNLYFWLYGHMAGKYPLMVLLSVGLIFCLTYLATAKTVKAKKIFLTLAFLVLGFCLSYAHQLWLFLPGFIYLIADLKLKFSKKVWLVSFLLFGLSFLVPLGSLLWLSRLAAPVSYSLSPGLNGWLAYLTKSEFFQNQFLPSSAAFVIKPLNLNPLSSVITSYLQVAVQSFSVLILLSLSLALIFGFRRKNHLFYFFLINFSLVGLLTVIYLGWSQDWLPKSDILPQLLPGFTAMVLLSLLGWYEIYRRVMSSLLVLLKPVWVKLIILCLVVTVGIYGIYQKFPIVDMYYFTSVPNRYQQILFQVPPESLLICYSQVSCYSLLYLQQINHLRPDITIMPLSYQLVKQTISSQHLENFDYPENSFVLVDVISKNIGQKPVIAVDMNDYYYNLLGFNVPFLYYIPHGSWGEITRQVPAKIPSYSLDFGTDADPTFNSDLDPMRLSIKTQPARDLLLNAGILIKMDQRARAIKEMNQAVNLFFKLSDQDRTQIESFRQNIEQTPVNQNFSPNAKVLSASQLLAYIPALINSNQYSKAYQAAFGAILNDPTNVTARLTFATILEKMGKIPESLQEYYNVLSLNSNNASAASAIQRLTP